MKQVIDRKTKPVGSLGRLEGLALQMGMVQNRLKPLLQAPHLLVFAADHGAASEGLSAYPPEITAQMVYNFVNGGAAINAFAQQHDFRLKIVDAGVNHEFPKDLRIVHAKMARGTHNFIHEPAMSLSQCEQTLQKGAELVREIQSTPCNVIAFGEMGISNTSSAALLMHGLTRIPLENCVGVGTGLDELGLRRKKKLLRQAYNRYTLEETDKNYPEEIRLLASLGGFEIAMMTGAMLQSASEGMLVLIDGFIATAALLVAHRICPEILEYCVFSHCSGEAGHRQMLNFLNVKPLLDLGLRLGEGTGAVLAYPLLVSAQKFLNEMASMDEL